MNGGSILLSRPSLGAIIGPVPLLAVLLRTRRYSGLGIVGRVLLLAGCYCWPGAYCRLGGIVDRCYRCLSRLLMLDYLLLIKADCWLDIIVGLDTIVGSTAE
jgi:hypothetical protein